MIDRQRLEPTHEFHGGDLADAAGIDGQTLRDNNQEWLDLSTGINPHAYPLPDLPDNVWHRLPGRIEIANLLAKAADCYGAPDTSHIVAAAGSQALIQVLPHCLPELPVAVIEPTYSGHVHGWQAAGRETIQCAALADCDPGGISILVNPNNPDGHIYPARELDEFANLCTRNGGWLIIDEAYCDLDPSLSLSSRCNTANVIVLRSFGKFFGLAGLRLGFAIAPLQLASKLRHSLGAWAISGPAIKIATKALQDFTWHETQRDILRMSATRLDRLLTKNGIAVAGGTSLFRLTRSPQAQDIFARLLEHGIYVRRFSDHPEWLRFGLPGTDTDWTKLERALISLTA